MKLATNLSTPLERIREIDIGEIRLAVDAVPEDWTAHETLRGTAMEGDEEYLRKIQDGRLKHFAVRVALLWHGQEPPKVLAKTYLGGCIYESYQAFATSPYIPDMVRELIPQAREKLGIEPPPHRPPRPKRGKELPNGATVLDAYQVDNHLYLVACRYSNEWVTWLYNRETGGCLRGRYFRTRPNFWRDFAGRIEDQSDLHQ